MKVRITLPNACTKGNELRFTIYLLVLVLQGTYFERDHSEFCLLSESLLAPLMLPLQFLKPLILRTAQSKIWAESMNLGLPVLDVMTTRLNRIGCLLKISLTRVQSTMEL